MKIQGRQIPRFEGDWMRPRQLVISTSIVATWAESIVEVAVNVMGIDA